MRIEFDPTNRDEATAVRAVLDAMYPNEWTMKVYTAKPVDAQALTEVGERIAETQEAATSEETVPDTDANGEPHDPRIHSTPPTLKNDGTWRAKRGVKAEEIAAVRAEREQATHPEQEPDPRLDGGPIAPDQEIANEPDEPEVMVAAAPSAPKPPSAPPAPAPVQEQSAPVAPDAPTGSEPSFLDVMKAITAAQKAGKVDTAKVKELCAAIGAGDSTMGLNGADKGELRVQFMALLDGECAQ